MGSKAPIPPPEDAKRPASPPPPPPPRASGCYAVGDRVRMRRTLTAAASDELPAQHFCTKGEVLIVRKVTGENRPCNGAWPVYVSHDHITDRSFGVMFDEIEAA